MNANVKRLARRLPGHSQMERVRAARAILNGSGREGAALIGFMAIFHPEVDQAEVTQAAFEIDERNRRR